MYSKLALIFLTLVLSSSHVMADPFKDTIDESANSINWDPAAPWKLPKGYTQEVISNESNLNIYTTPLDDWNDMNTVNETGSEKGKFLYRTHEVRDNPDGGAVSVVNLKTGETKVLAQNKTWNALDGIIWTPWGTLLFAEETRGGRLFEIFLNPDHVTTSDVVHRDQVGLMAHEGIEIDEKGNVYIVDEHRGLTSESTCGAGVLPCGGGIYKFVPDNEGDLSSGELFVLKVFGDTFEGIGLGSWVGPIDPLHARASGSAFGGQSYQRPEDLEIIENNLYVAVTEGTRDAAGNQNYDGRVLKIDLETLAVSDYVKPGVNVPVEIGRPGDSVFTTGFDNPDNLAKSPEGRLVIIEDNVPSDIWFVDGEDDDVVAEKVNLFASLTDPEAEGTGIYFSPNNKKTLFVNVQHSKSPDGDSTWAIRKGPEE